MSPISLWNVSLSTVRIFGQIKSICYQNNFYILTKGDMWITFYLHTKCFLSFSRRGRYSEVLAADDVFVHVVPQNENVAREMKQHCTKIFQKNIVDKSAAAFNNQLLPIIYWLMVLLVTFALHWIQKSLLLLVKLSIFVNQLSFKNLPKLISS